MEPRTLDYMTPRSVAFDWRTLLRWFLLGSFTGACVGCALTTAALLCWIWHGQPDFYFRGWSGVKVQYFVLIVGGGIVGAAYGLASWVFERLSRRRVRLSIAPPATVVFAFAIELLIAKHEFQRQQIGFVMLPELIAVCFGLVMSIATARRTP